MQGKPALCAGDLAALLPKSMALVAVMAMWAGLVQTAASEKALKGGFIASLVNAGAAFDTTKIASRLFQLMLCLFNRLGLVLLEQLLDDLLAGLLLGHGHMWTGRFGNVFLNAELRTGFLEPLFDHNYCQGLVHSDPTCPTLVSTAVRCPSVQGCEPWFVAPAYELLLVLLGVLALMSIRFLMQVVVFVLVDLGKSFNGVLVYELGILINNVLPFGSFAALKLLCPLPSCQSCIPLSPSQLWLTAGCFR